MNEETKIYTINRDNFITVDINENDKIVYAICNCGVTNIIDETKNRCRIIYQNLILSILNEYDNESKIIHCYSCKQKIKIDKGLLIVLKEQEVKKNKLNFYVINKGETLKKYSHDGPPIKTGETKTGTKFSYLERGKKKKWN